MTKAKKPECRKKIRGSWASYIVDGRGVCNTIELAKMLVAWGNIPERLSDAKACGGNYKIFPMDGWIAVGFGYASLEKDGKVIWSEDAAKEEGDIMTGQQAEDLAAQDPDHDWRIKKIGPLKVGEWQRQSPGHWVLYREGMGFA